MALTAARRAARCWWTMCLSPTRARPSTASTQSPAKFWQAAKWSVPRVLPSRRRPTPRAWSLSVCRTARSRPLTQRRFNPSGFITTRSEGSQTARSPSAVTTSIPASGAARNLRQTLSACPSPTKTPRRPTRRRRPAGIGQAEAATIGQALTPTRTMCSLERTTAMTAIPRKPEASCCLMRRRAGCWISGPAFSAMCAAPSATTRRQMRSTLPPRAAGSAA